MMNFTDVIEMVGDKLTAKETDSFAKGMAKELAKEALATIAVGGAAIAVMGIGANLFTKKQLGFVDKKKK